MPLREATSEDFEMLWQIDQRCFPPGIAYSKEELGWFMSRPRAFTLISQATDKIAGFLLVNYEEMNRSGRADIDSSIGHLITIDVLPEARRSGVGTELLASAEQRLSHEKCRSLLLETAVDNDAALRFYKKHGFDILRTLPRYYPNG